MGPNYPGYKKDIKKINIQDGLKEFVTNIIIRTITDV